MIAVFVRDDRCFDEFKITPKTTFKRIRGIEDIRGYTFTNVLTGYNWWESGKKIQDAFNALQIRQPKLFE